MGHDVAELIGPEFPALLLFIPFFSNGRLERAMDLIRARGGNRYLADVRIRERWTFLVFGTIYCTDVLAATYGRR